MEGRKFPGGLPEQVLEGNCTTGGLPGSQFNFDHDTNVTTAAGTCDKTTNSGTIGAVPGTVLSGPCGKPTNPGPRERTGGIPLAQADGDAGNKAVITFIDFVAVFDSISHRFLDEALKEAEASDKSRAVFRAIYKSATAVVRVSPPGGGDKVLTGPFPADRGVIQGDSFSPICFIIALEHLMRLSDDGGTMTVLGVLISKLEYADDVALVCKDCEEATARVTRIAVEAK